MRILWLLLCFLASWARAEAPTNNAINVLEQVSLSAPEEARAKALGNELRCPVCRGVPIIESPNDLARQLMLDVRKQIKAGKTDEEIRSFFVARYGENILLNPPKKGINWLLWLLPTAALLLGLGWVWQFLKPKTALHISSEDLAKVDSFLQEKP